MSKVEIKHLFRNNRLPENDSSLILFILYLPFGLLLFLLRTVILLSLFLLANVLPESRASYKLLNKLACLALGISVNVENPKMKENVDVYISNNLSIFDHLAVCNATGAVSPKSKSIFDNIFGLSNRGFGSTDNFEPFKKNVIQFITEKRTPVYFTPEDKPTNGKALLKFKTYPFKLTEKIQPVCITIERPFLDIALSTIGSTCFNDVFFYTFCPVTNYKLKFLAPLEKKCISEAEFADIVSQNIATSLKIELSEFTSSDLAEWEKKKIIEKQQRAQAHARSLNPDLRRMTLQVKEVLPHVPFNTIYNDIFITRSVDGTITNILEGRIHFTPETSTSSDVMNQPSTSSGSRSDSPSPGASSANSFKMAATAFPKSASERSKSFQERKEQLIASARRRYIEKHNLDIPF